MKCPECGTEFAPQGGGKRTKRFCSKACRHKSYRRDSARVERARQRARARYAADPKRAMARTLAWRERQPVASLEAARRTRLKRLGLTPVDFDRLAAVDQHCPICWRLFGEGLRPVADHDHTTGEFRGVICSDCNVGLGMFHDSWESLFKAVQYLTARERKTS